MIDFLHSKETQSISKIQKEIFEKEKDKYNRSDI